MSGDSTARVGTIPIVRDSVTVHIRATPEEIWPLVSDVTNTAKDKQHGFKIAEFGVEEVIDQGKTTTVKFKADKAGTFQVICHLHPTHKPAELVVS